MQVEKLWVGAESEKENVSFIYIWTIHILPHQQYFLINIQIEM